MMLSKLLFEPTLIRSPLRVVRWWESRRPAYNLVVGTVGLATLTYVNALEWVLGNGLFPVPWIGIVAYGVAANLAYTLGPVVELATEKWLGRPAYGLGPALFRYGLVFAVGLTLLPAVLITLVNVVGTLLK